MKFFSFNKKQLLDLLKRAGWTFLQAFLAVWILTPEPFTTGALVASGAAGISAIKSYILTN